METKTLVNLAVRHTCETGPVAEHCHDRKPEPTQRRPNPCRSDKSPQSFPDARHLIASRSQAAQPLASTELPGSRGRGTERAPADATRLQTSGGTKTYSSQILFAAARAASLASARSIKSNPGSSAIRCQYSTAASPISRVPFAGDRGAEVAAGTGSKPSAFAAASGKGPALSHCSRSAWPSASSFCFFAASASSRPVSSPHRI